VSFSGAHGESSDRELPGLPKIAGNAEALINFGHYQILAISAISLPPGHLGC
jgi:hypothetical protein